MIMKKIKVYYPLIVTIFLAAILLVLLFFFLQINLDSNFFVALVTLVVGSGAIYLYIAQRIDAKRDAARIIVQEIGRAEDIIKSYKESNSFQFTKKLIANNSWGKNIHFFVVDLAPDERDRISDLYSTGEFLDTVIQNIFNWKFEYESRKFYEEVPTATLNASIPLPGNVNMPGVSPTGGTPLQGPGIQMQVPKPPQPFWNDLLNSVVSKYEPIYHTPIVEKLKKIAEL